MKSNKVFMAIASGSESKESDRKLYVGIAPVFVVDVNPSKEGLSKFFGYDAEEPEYIGTSEVGPEGDKQEVPQVRIDFLVATDSKKTNGIEMKTKVSFYLKKAIRYNTDKTKVQVIDKYGRTAWPTVEEAAEHIIPEYASGPANIDAGYRPAYIGEEELTGFIKAYLNIPSPSFSYTDKKTGEKVVRILPNPDDALARLDKIVDYFKGDFKELKSILRFQPRNTVKCMFGVKTTDEGRQYQAVYTQKFIKSAVSDYSRLDKELQDRKNAGAYSNVEFSVKPLMEYKVESTSFDQPSGGSPFDEPIDDTPWFLSK